MQFILSLSRVIQAAGVVCYFCLNLSSDLTLRKSSLNFWLKSEIWDKSEAALHLSLGPVSPNNYYALMK